MKGLGSFSDDAVPFTDNDVHDSTVDERSHWEGEPKTARVPDPRATLNDVNHMTLVPEDPRKTELEANVCQSQNTDFSKEQTGRLTPEISANVNNSETPVFETSDCVYKKIFHRGGTDGEET